MDNSEKLNLLLVKLENLLLRQQSFEAEIKALQNEVKHLQTPDASLQTATPIPQTVTIPPLKSTVPDPVVQANIIPPAFKAQVPAPPSPAQPNFADRFKRENIVKSDFEKFIGENLISKVGILILIIGVGIGAKYAIDHDMISPLTRIILGYLVGVGLTGFAIRLKAKYENFSAVLISGAIAIMYFITFAAYDFYQLIPQAVTFILMVVFTAFGIVAALKYNRQVIAHIGLVGAYAVPFLLSDGSGKVAVLFSYMAIINIGILIIGFKRYWKPLFYTSFTLTWIIYLAWRLNIPSGGQTNLSLIFATCFFTIFYITNLAYKIIRKEIFALTDILIILANAFIYYGIGYYIISESKNIVELTGLFTLMNAVIHFAVCLVIRKKELGDKNLFYLILALVITFITLTVPVQLNGGWVTIFWTIEAAVLFYLGRVKAIGIYEKISFPIIFLAFLSLTDDWTASYRFSKDYEPILPVLNVGFLTGLISIAGFSWMLKTNNQQKDSENGVLWIKQILNYALPAILILVTYVTFRLEIAKYFDNLYESTSINTKPTIKNSYLNLEYNHNLLELKTAWIMVYTLFFASAITFFNIKKLKNKDLALANLVINMVVIITFLTYGLLTISELRDTWISPPNRFFTIGSFNVGIRYVSLCFFAVLLIVCYRLFKSELLSNVFNKMFDYILYISILWIISSELINILELLRLNGTYKLGLSILWGVYSLFLIGVGLAYNKKHLRIGAMILFGLTLIKLFLYDIAYLGTISKTIVFVSLGVLLLIISFLYNKYKHLIIDDVKTEN